MELVTLPKPTPDEDWLARAKSGENIAIAIAGITADKEYDTSYFGAAHDLAGVVAYLQHRICSAIAT